ncbi:Fe-S oxidoreductase [Rhizobium sp. Root708]|uniref:YkgJ family cysteine cluster protein n=1 Tax=Rhizobium sp. Root708 TaxID=1736592 RepID=UPI0006FCB276|nr:YkgJ family cysteine cluster protein [Rhizobium sp. Root708]KRB49973.1 Fe-S oxidoreductase [Rhizobium sp. Root708]
MTASIDFDCQACGACCSFSSSWPRFSTETDEELDEIPPHFVSDDQQGMRCHGDRCVALHGRVGVNTSCSIYEIRPDVCRACMPGDGACLEARAAYGFG